MTNPIHRDDFTNALLLLLDETFDQEHGIYLDKGTSMFATLDAISAEEASLPIGRGCASIAAQVKHVAFYLEVMENYFRTPGHPEADWDLVWQTTKEVAPAQWEGMKSELRQNYARIKALIEHTPAWTSERPIAEIISVVVHTAYHLGEIRQALCMINE